MMRAANGRPKVGVADRMRRHYAPETRWPGTGPPLPQLAWRSNPSWQRHRPGWSGAGAPGGPPKAEPGARSAGPAPRSGVAWSNTA